MTKTEYKAKVIALLTSKPTKRQLKAAADAILLASDDEETASAVVAIDTVIGGRWVKCSNCSSYYRRKFGCDQCTP